MQTHRKHTTINLDLALLHEAAQILGTQGSTDTIHAALREVVNRQKRQLLLDYDFPGLTLESLEMARGLRTSASVEDVQPV